MTRYLFAWLFMASATMAKSQGMEPDDIHRLHSVRDVAVSPDGQSILYSESDSSDAYRVTSRLMVYERGS